MWINKLFTEDVLAFINGYLLGVEAIAAILVAYGIVWESAEAGESFKRVAHATVVVGVCAETLFTVLLFSSEERISSLQKAKIDAQQSKIVALEERLAPRIINASGLTELISILKPFAGTPFDMAINPTPEPMSFATRISDALTEAGWRRVSNPDAIIVFGVGDNTATLLIWPAGLSIEVQASKTDEWKDAFLALHHALAVAGFKNNATIATDAKVPANAIHIYVGAKE